MPFDFSRIPINSIPEFLDQKYESSLRSGSAIENRYPVLDNRSIRADYLYMRPIFHDEVRRHKQNRKENRQLLLLAAVDRLRGDYIGLATRLVFPAQLCILGNHRIQPLGSALSNFLHASAR